MERRLAAILAADMVAYSRLMEADEEGVIARQKAHRKALIDPAIAERKGQIVKTTGDGMLAEFASAQDAVRCAIHIQAGMTEREAAEPDETRIQYRVGINVGDIVFDDGDVFGDGVNIAARLEGLAKPGGVCISDSVYQMLHDRLPEPFADLGTQRVKNISRPIRVWQWTAETRAAAQPVKPAADQQIGFCIAPDGTQLAYASVGSGPPVMKAPNWLNHLDYEWRSPIWGPAWSAMAKRYRLVRFDQRGNGLSDWEGVAFSHDAMIADMETVADAAGLDTFAMFAISQGCAFSIRYAAENPERVRCLVLLNGYTRGSLKRSAEQTALHAAASTMIRQGWGSSNPAYRQFFTDAFMPDATPDQKASFDELQRMATSPENAAQIFDMNGDIDVSDLAREVRVPTLVVHCEGDRRVPQEEGRRMAALIPGARFMALPSNNHALVEGDSAFGQFFQAFREFMQAHGGA